MGTNRADGCGLAGRRNDLLVIGVKIFFNFSGIFSIQNRVHFQQRPCKVRGILQQLQQLYLRQPQNAAACFLRLCAEKVVVDLLRKVLAVIRHDVGVDICHHAGLCMAGVTLYGFDIAAADLQLQTGAAVAETVEHDGLQTMLSDQAAELVHDLTGLHRPAVVLRVTTRP